MEATKNMKILSLILGVCILAAFNGFSKTLEWTQTQKKTLIQPDKVNIVKNTDFMDIYKAKDSKDPDSYHYIARYIDMKDVPAKDIKHVYMVLNKEQADSFDSGKPVTAKLYACKKNGRCGNDKHFLPPPDDKEL